MFLNKDILLKIPFILWINNVRKKKQDLKYAKLREPYIKELESLLDKNTSIISSNCFAGRVMQDLGMQYNTPTLGLWIMPDDFPKFCLNLRQYLTEKDLTLAEHSKNKLGEYQHAHPSSHHNYPIGILGDIEIHFLHYRSKEEAFSKWKRRSQRVDYNNLLFIGSEQNGCTEDDIKAFDSLPTNRKIFFSSKPYKYDCVVYIKEFSELGHAGDPYKQGHIYYRYFVEWLKKQFENEE